MSRHSIETILVAAILSGLLIALLATLDAAGVTR